MALPLHSEEIGDTSPQTHPLQSNTLDLSRQQQTGQQDEHSATVQPVESDHADVYPDDDSTLGDSPDGESLNGEPVQLSAGFKAGENPATDDEPILQSVGSVDVGDQEAIPTSPNTSNQAGTGRSSSECNRCNGIWRNSTNRFYSRTTRKTRQTRASSSIRAESKILRPAVKTFYIREGRRANKGLVA